jgi:hypothetical protein
MPKGDFNAKGFVFFDNSQGYDWDALPPICWFNRWKQISSFKLDQSGFFPWIFLGTFHSKDLLLD